MLPSQCARAPPATPATATGVDIHWRSLPGQVCCAMSIALPMAPPGGWLGGHRHPALRARRARWRWLRRRNACPRAPIGTIRRAGGAQPSITKMYYFASCADGQKRLKAALLDRAGAEAIAPTLALHVWISRPAPATASLHLFAEGHRRRSHAMATVSSAAEVADHAAPRPGPTRPASRRPRRCRRRKHRLSGDRAAAGGAISLNSSSLHPPPGIASLACTARYLVPAHGLHLANRQGSASPGVAKCVFVIDIPDRALRHLNEGARTRRAQCATSPGPHQPVLLPDHKNIQPCSYPHASARRTSAAAFGGVQGAQAHGTGYRATHAWRGGHVARPEPQGARVFAGQRRPVLQPIAHQIAPRYAGASRAR